MKVLVIGANGKIGRHLMDKLSASAGFEATALIRKKEQAAYFKEQGIATLVGTIEATEEEIGTLIRNFDALVFTAGSGGKTGFDKTLEVDLDGAIKTIHAAQKHQVRRFIMVSAARADDRDYWNTSPIKPYYIAKHYADKELQRADLDYTIVRPVRLTDEPEEGTVTLHFDDGKIEPEVPRIAVAEIVLRILQEQKTYRKIIQMSAGKDAIPEALKNLK